jgi:hypothetical protein
MSPLTLADLADLDGAGASVTLHHGTDVASATEIRQNGLSVGKAQALAGSGSFWATDDINEANWLAQVNPANGQPARLDFELPAAVLVQLVSASPPQAEFHQDDGIEFFPTSFALMNAHMSNKQVVLVP